MQSARRMNTSYIQLWEDSLHALSHARSSELKTCRSIHLLLRLPIGKQCMLRFCPDIHMDHVDSMIPKNEAEHKTASQWRQSY